MREHRFIRFGRVGVIATVAALCLASHSAWAQKATEKMTEDRQGFRKSVLLVRGQIDTTLSALNGIVEGKDAGARKSALKKYRDEIKAMDKEIEKTRGYAESMKERGKDYFKAWEKKTKSVDNPELKEAATARRTTLQAQYEKIHAGIEQARQVSAKFWKDLQDLLKYYENDLSDEAIASSSGLVKSTTADGKKIQGFIDDVVAAVDQVGATVEKTPEGEKKPEEEKAPEGEEKPQGDEPPSGE